VKVQLEQLAATQARRRTARLWFPAPAALSVLGAARFPSQVETEKGSFGNWYVTLEQEVETGGQRGARLRAVDAGIVAQSHRVVVTKRDIALNAWITWFDAVAAEEQLRLARRIEALLSRVATAARATADRGLLAPLDADTADAQSVRASQERAAAERRLTAARVALLTQLGRRPGDPLVVEGELSPVRFAATLDGVDVDGQPEVQALVADQRFQREQASLFRRLRAPNLVLSLNGENDGFNEKVVGAGIAFPLVLPEPVGRLHSGDIAEAEALARRAAVEAEQERRLIREQVAVARQAYHSLVEAVARYTPERIAQANRSLESIADHIANGRLSVRDALLAQQTLLELLLADVEARHALCVASVELARAAGVALEDNPQ
jgi:cobalt-zinc-cadmium efflux system outer membrane protein